MTVRRSGNFGTYFLVGFIGMLIGSVIGRTIVNILKSRVITDLVYLYGFANKFIIKAGYAFNLNLIAIIGIILAIYIYRKL